MKNNPRPWITTVAFHVALWPMVLGVAIVLAWYVERLSWLPIAGLSLLYVIPVNFLFVVFLTVSSIKNKRIPIEDRLNPKFFSTPLLALLMNYIVGILCLAAGSYIGNRADILITNNSNFRLEAIQTQDPSGTQTDFPDIESNDKASLSFYPEGEGGVTVSFTANGKDIVTTPVSYLFWGSGNSGSLIIEKDLGHSVGPEGEPPDPDSSFLEESKK